VIQNCILFLERWLYGRFLKKLPEMQKQKTTRDFSSQFASETDNRSCGTLRASRMNQKFPTQSSKSRRNVWRDYIFLKRRVELTLRCKNKRPES
jgi:hypothetical protein